MHPVPHNQTLCLALLLWVCAALLGCQIEPKGSTFTPPVMLEPDPEPTPEPQPDTPEPDPAPDNTPEGPACDPDEAFLCQDLLAEMAPEVAACNRPICAERRCISAPLSDGTRCDFPGEQDVCLQATCQSGVCVQAAVPDAARVRCDDGDPCTQDDHCSAGECVSTINTCECNIDEDCPAGDLCTGRFVCVGQSASDRRCVAEAPVDCPNPPGGTDCITNACNPSTGQCEETIHAGDVCASDDPCLLDGVCDPRGVCSQQPLDCNAAAPPCHQASCRRDDLPPDFDPEIPTSACRFEPLSGFGCDDGSRCTQGDTCVEGRCEGQSITDCGPTQNCEASVCDPDTGLCGPPEPVICEDADQCNAGVCDPQTEGCALIPLDGVACDDGDTCTTGDTCVQGVCTGQVGDNTGAQCDDGNACTQGDVCGDERCGGAPLEDIHEDNDTRPGPELDSIDPCVDNLDRDIEGIVASGGDEDHFRFVNRGNRQCGLIQPMVQLHNAGSAALEVCAHFRCAQEREPSVECLQSSRDQTPPEGTQGCCVQVSPGRTRDFSMRPNCSSADPEGTAFIRVRALEDALSCGLYTLRWGNR